MSAINNPVNTKFPLKLKSINHQSTNIFGLTKYLNNLALESSEHVHKITRSQEYRVQHACSKPT